ncbi:MAG: GspE/PulE family protein [Verrucomicrobiales bacterium]
MDAPATVNALIARAAQARASDIHLQMSPTGAEVNFRMDGVMTPVTTFAAPLAEKVFGRIKYLAKLKTYQESMPQDGRIDKADVGGENDVRVSTYPTVTGEKIVLRFFVREAQVDLKDLGLPDAALSELTWALRQNSGLILLTGPAGSGKTTTIYAALRQVASLGGRHIITVEDPVEQIIPGVMQTEVNEGMGLTFSKAARHLLRQDPQALVIGEVRDEDTASICLRAASTGHLVISTLHGGSCQGVMERFTLLCPDQFALFNSTRLILNQRLIRKLCAACRGSGCDCCLGTGYFGRRPVVEFFSARELPPRKLVTEGFDAFVAKRSLREEADLLLRESVTDLKEIERVFGPA